MKLIPEQIDQLYTFTRQHYVEWYDLQSELVDHLANAIETELEENPKLTFDEALSKEFQKFGVFGFMDVIEEKRKSLGKKYNLIIWHHFKAFFRIPKIILTASTIGIVYMILKQIEEQAASGHKDWIIIESLRSTESDQPTESVAFSYGKIKMMATIPHTIIMDMSLTDDQVLSTINDIFFQLGFRLKALKMVESFNLYSPDKNLSNLIVVTASFVGASYVTYPFLSKCA